jgi:hypothetical protein
MRLRNLSYLLVFVLVAAQPAAAGVGIPQQAQVALSSSQSDLKLSLPSDLRALDRGLSQARAFPLPPAVGGQGFPPENLPLELRTKFEPALLKQLLQSPKGAAVRGIVYMSERPDLQGIGLSGMDVLTRRETIVGQLRSLADRSQRQVREVLERGRAEQRVAAFKPLWIVNGIAVTAPRQVFLELAARPDIAHIRQDHPPAVAAQNPVSSTLVRRQPSLSLCRRGPGHRHRHPN